MIMQKVDNLYRDLLEIGKGNVGVATDRLKNFDIYVSKVETSSPDSRRISDMSAAARNASSLK